MNFYYFYKCYLIFKCEDNQDEEREGWGLS